MNIKRIIFSLFLFFTFIAFSEYAYADRISSIINAGKKIFSSKGAQDVGKAAGNYGYRVGRVVNNKYKEEQEKRAKMMEDIQRSLQKNQNKFGR